MWGDRPIYEQGQKLHVCLSRANFHILSAKSSFVDRIWLAKLKHKHIGFTAAGGHGFTHWQLYIAVRSRKSL